MIGENQFACYKCCGISFSVEIPWLAANFVPFPEAIGEKTVDMVLTCLNPECRCKITITTERIGAEMRREASE